jgi:hypothetical protein
MPLKVGWQHKYHHQLAAIAVVVAAVAVANDHVYHMDLSAPAHPHQHQRHHHITTAHRVAVADLPRLPID